MRACVRVCYCCWGVFRSPSLTRRRRRGGVPRRGRGAGGRVGAREWGGQGGERRGCRQEKDRGKGPGRPGACRRGVLAHGCGTISTRGGGSVAASAVGPSSWPRPRAEGSGSGCGTSARADATAKGGRRGGSVPGVSGERPRDAVPGPALLAKCDAPTGSKSISTLSSIASTPRMESFSNSSPSTSGVSESGDDFSLERKSTTERSRLVQRTGNLV